MDEIYTNIMVFSNSKGKFHKSCYKKHRLPNCYVCKEKIPSNAQGIEYNEHPFWLEKYCPSHDTDGTAKCCSCERLKPIETKYVMLGDGRWLCLECLESTIMDTDECQVLHIEIREFFEGLNMKIENEFPLLLVEKEALNRTKEYETIDNHHEVVIRGSCLSEERIISIVSRAPKMGPNGIFIDMGTESQMLVRQCEVTAVLVMYGLPRLLTGSILAHEMMHAWLRLNGYNDLKTELEDGLCQVIAHMWLESQTCNADASSHKPTKATNQPWESNFEKKLVELFKMQIEDDYSPHGDGFRKVNEMVSNSSIQETLKSVRNSKSVIDDAYRINTCTRRTFTRKMFYLRFSNSAKSFNFVITQQVRFFSRDPFPNKLQHYLYRATLIDSIRLSLRSTTTSATTLASLLNHRLVDSFVVKNALRSSPSIASAWSIFKTTLRLKNPNFTYESETLHAFATVLAKFHCSSELSSLIGVINAGKFGNVRFSFMNLMNLYATAGDFDSVLKTWDEYRCSGDEKKGCTESYNIVMQVYMSLGKDSEAVQTFDLMVNEGGIPNSRTFTIMIEHLVSLGNLDAAMKVFETLPLMRITRTLKHYSVLVGAFVDAQRFGEVKVLLAEMKADGKFPSRRMLEPLKRMREAGFEQETEEFLSEMLPDERIKDISMYSMDNPSDSEEEGDEHNDDVNEGQVKLKPWLDPKALANSLKKWSSDAVTALEEANFVWTNLLVCKMLRNFRSPETAWSFFCWVATQPGFTHDAYTIERMMAMLARNGQVELVDKLISKVRIEGINLPFSTIRLIIDLYGISKKPDAAIKVFHEDRTLCGSISHFNLMLLYSSLLRTLTKCKKNAEALENLEEMISSSVFPDIQTFSGLMYHFALQGDIQTVQRLFSTVRQIGLEPDPYMLKLLVQAYCRCERSVLAFRVYQDMKDLNLMPDKETKELLVRSLWREEKRKEAAVVENSDEEANGGNSVLRLVLKGHVWTISSTDISRVYSLYRDCVLKTPS
ncbi:hypothetical protein AALP_AA8G503500 [Arabis alpina]|uniref:Protein DA1-like domain-containing protein n=1 Tax=Arabis alpina TaxID=50452 RepID=A0A087GEN7_ARAAL|nr:hypothetical protein AALP_AA8G503500 [Arabis alpina]